MKLLVARLPWICIFVVVAAVAMPVDAGGTRAKSSAHRGHSVPHRGVSSFYRQSRGLPNGISIFNRPTHTSRAAVNKAGKRKHAGKAPGDARRHSKSRGKFKKDKHAKHDSNRRGKKRSSKKKHKGRKHKHAIYATSVYVAQPLDEIIYPEYSDEEDCRQLTERGYDRSGRWVLVEWTLCFDEQGEAYVPAEGRRILARY